MGRIGKRSLDKEALKKKKNQWLKRKGKKGREATRGGGLWS